MAFSHLLLIHSDNFAKSEQTLERIQKNTPTVKNK